MSALLAMALSACSSPIPPEPYREFGPVTIHRSAVAVIPAGATFAIVEDDAESERDPLFARYASVVAKGLARRGLRAVDSPESAAYLVRLGYGVDEPVTVQHAEQRRPGRVTEEQKQGFGFDERGRLQYVNSLSLGIGIEDDHDSAKIVKTYTEETFAHWCRLRAVSSATGATLWETSAKRVLRFRGNARQRLLPIVAAAIHAGENATGEILIELGETDPLYRELTKDVGLPDGSTPPSE